VHREWFANTQDRVTIHDFFEGVEDVFFGSGSASQNGMFGVWLRSAATGA